MMEPGILFFGLFFLLLFIGVPIAVSVGITALVFLWGYNLGIQVMSTNFFANIAKFPLLAIPFFILAGFLMDRVGLSRRLVNLLHLLVGPIPGGLGIVAVLGCVLFGAISGTGPADTAAIGAVMIPAMVKRGYDIGFSSALVASAATTDVLIPPSVAFVVYGVITETSIGGLFAAGIIPGLIMGTALVLPVYLISKRHGWGGELNGLLLIAGMLLDAISIYYVFLPILIPMIRHFGWDPMWFGVMMTVNLAIGTVTPPVALNLYVAANLAGISMEKISRAAVPFVLALVAALLVITYIPSLSLWLPRVFGFR